MINFFVFNQNLYIFYQSIISETNNIPLQRHSIVLLLTKELQLIILFSLPPTKHMATINSRPFSPPNLKTDRKRPRWEIPRPHRPTRTDDPIFRPWRQVSRLHLRRGYGSPGLQNITWWAVARWKKWSHFDLKSRVTGGTKSRPGIPSIWRIFESK